MTLPTEICNKQCIRTEWHVALPEANQSVQSPSLSLETSKWVFKLSCLSDGKLKLKFVIIGDSAVPESFLLTLHLRRKDERDNVFITFKVIDCPEVEVYNFSRVYLVRKYPQAFFSQNRLKFLFTFDYGIRLFQDYKIDELQCLESLSLDYSKLMDDGSDSDVSLKCGDRTIPANRLILGARSEVFRTMLQSDMLEGREGSVEIVDMEPEVFQIFIRYLYTGRLPVLSEDTALALYEAGDKYHVNALKDVCSNFLAKNLTREDACEVLVTADGHGDEDLKERVISYILFEEIPSDDEVWLKFCESHPKLAFDVLTLFYKKSVRSQ